MIPALSEALAERGFDTLTPVQIAVTAPELDGADLLVSAQTGSGKTVGFGMAIAPTLLGEATHFGLAAAPLALVIAPTRELAFQVMRELTWLYAKTGAVVTPCVGGMDSRQERRALERGVHIVVGTPGRLRDHIERGALDLGDLRAVVLDEADEMLDLGFREDLEFILSQAPETRRTLLFSATVSANIARLAEQFQRDARRINTRGSTDQHSDITYQALRVGPSDSEHAIFNLLRYHDAQSAIVFANTRAQVSHLAARLGNRGLATVTLSGELSQTERTHALQAMRDGRARVCVATDVAARGIDLPNLELVIHADLPSNTESLLHRSGRTGRAGRKGISALIVPPKALGKAQRLLKWAKITAEWGAAPSVEEVLRRDEERLLSDPLWDQPPSEEEASFAARLLDQQTPEQIAAAYLRLFQARHAAPEELSPPDAKPPARAERSFGPSKWFSLSVGHKDRAEARWLLPLLCRSGNLEKSAIGAIRVQESETFVEIAEAAGVKLAAQLTGQPELEEGIVARALESVPDLGAARPDTPRDTPPRAPRSEGARAKPRAPRPEGPRDAPRKPRADAGPRKKSNDAAATRAGAAPPAPQRSAPRVPPAPQAPAPKPEAPRPAKGAAPKPAARPAAKLKRPDAPPRRGDAPDARRKPDASKAQVRDGAKGTDRKPGKSFTKPVPKASDPRDASQRYVPPGGAKPGPRKPRPKGAPRPGGSEPPRRGKR